LADSNADLINIFKFLKKEHDKFITYCADFFDSSKNNEKIYFKNRHIFNTTTDLRLKAALFLYLNRHAYNGLIRYNSKGIFNVPFGQYKKPYFPAKEMLAFAGKATIAQIYHADFLTTMQKAKPGDVVYCDPPYMPLSRTANFTHYSSNDFNIPEQAALASMAKKLVTKGVTVIISNHDTVLTNELYNAAKIQYFDVQRFISCKGKQRNKAKEILAVFTK
jgi:DNA adenine methylase